MAQGVREGMMFTDEQLGRVKQRRREMGDDPLGDGYLDAFEIDGLIKRLEAAENIASIACHIFTCRAIITCDIGKCDCGLLPAMGRWRKECGK